MIRKIRERTKVLISFGDCAVTANVPAMRDPLPNNVETVLNRAYIDGGDLNAQIPVAPGIVPPLAGARAADSRGGARRYLPAGLSAAGASHQGGAGATALGRARAPLGAA